MEVFDFHCDTLYKSMMNDLLLDADIYEFKISDLMKEHKWHQCMAVWTPDDSILLQVQKNLFQNVKDLKFLLMI